MKKKEYLVDRIESFLKKHDGWHCGGYIQDLAKLAGYEQSNAARRLRELTADGIIEVEYRKGQNGAKVAWYRYKQKEVVRSQYVEREGRMVEVKQVVYS